jgi:hypothetical protein
MTKKIVIGGVLAGITLFVWSAIVHMLPVTGELGIKTITNEDAVIAAMKANITESGFYFIPGEGMTAAKTLPKEQQQAVMDAWQKKLEAGPRAILIYHPTGDKLFNPRYFIVEFLSDIVIGLIAAFVLAMASGKILSFGGRVGFVALLGLIGFVTTDVSYWNWYGFPTAYELAQFLDQFVGMALAGVVLAFIMRKV